MAELLTAAQMRAIEQAAIASGEVTGLELMERAGRGVVEAIFEEWPELAKERGPAPAPPGYLQQEERARRAVVLCGPGNNGGDGFAVARLLHARGWTVEVFLYGDPEKLPPDARVNYERWLELGEVLPAEVRHVTKAAPFDLRIDAVFGTGLRRPPDKELWSVFEATRKAIQWQTGAAMPKSVAVDCPSCLDLDSGKPILPPKIWEGDLHLDFLANLTVTFHRRKIGHAITSEWDYCRKITVRDIGLEGSPRPPGGIVELLEQPSDWLEKFDSGHKYTHGHALILSGGSGKTGAARLAARGALRIGAGLVTLGVPPSAQQEVACQITALMLKRIDGADGFAAVLEDSRLNALCLGPGMGVERARHLVPVALAAKRATVLDADALTAYAENPAELFAHLHENCVLTPHGGEFARLFPDISAKLTAPATKGPAYSKVDATREAAKRAGCVVLFKGADTVIAVPDGRCSVNSAHYGRSAPWLATAGSGDVLAGFITGLLARGLAPMQAAETAAWLHVECALEFGPGLIAEDLPEQLPAVFRKLGL